MPDSNKGMVSVIIPVYNAASFLDDTLQCFLNQTYENFEVILVDDGSVDESADICKRFVLGDKRFRYLRQRNAGAGAARNRGIDLARGEYLLFADADDLYERDYLAQLCATLRCEKSDVAICRADTFVGLYANSATRAYAAYPERRSCSPGQIAERFFQSVTCVPWDKLFSASLVKRNGLRFQTLRYSNDNYFVLMALMLAERIAWGDDVLVHHRISAGGGLSVTRCT